ncbi:MAG: hypothetical protein ACUZ8N_09275 [Candidatus Scalindua sp.]
MYNYTEYSDLKVIFDCYIISSPHNYEAYYTKTDLVLFFSKTKSWLPARHVVQAGSYPRTKGAEDFPRTKGAEDFPRTK